MGLAVTILAIAVLAAIFLLLRRKGPVPDRYAAASRTTNRIAVNEFHAVSIRFAASACSAAKGLEGKRFLSRAAPKLPVADCDVPECKCRFQHHADRRSGEDRRNPYVGKLASDTGAYRREQRTGHDRRQNSQAF